MHRLFLTLSRVMAILGGFVLSILILIVCLSIIGRSANSFLHTDVAQSLFPGLAQWLIDAGVGAIRGDFELVEAGMAFSIFAFLPLTQVTVGHATVDIFTSWMPERALRILRALIEVLFAVVLIVIAVQLFSGMQSKIRSGQTTLLLQFPVWWAYAGSVLGAGVAAVVAVYMALARVAEATTGRSIVTDELGAEH
ncbi:TRAP transporter small permease [Ponticoccus sp. SC2-23]|uniref:TRAP transporter small permease n=1 Tax=Alexandriicola marinus TaxID=2081710 RepID=UPI000FDA388E|nr:TRAP transporter small permease [Alexandriicola marinus]MBM1221679.1 TRAP transporter small permease [Ponticoccus sp. SC6-9]MBM1226030.1 TRAP transporter small permease [Ponticoccus sp. SC6-15]MBM1231327.1 TRAP transporter small permease [Ponticoccus sp. SC6-38]MBM1235812.1 TRAP transporter small permease [Ponticoccus sp. SC6-45]MBM1240350.1 TRAP transporter small permease [Ponticoccus sp. SC6-49]MBM1244885.1 TRAP transporter small permease [Ponticoccus sp. SC2-64]MBM1249286.1 TRAP transp